MTSVTCDFCGGPVGERTHLVVFLSQEWPAEHILEPEGPFSRTNRQRSEFCDECFEVLSAQYIQRRSGKAVDEDDGW